MPEKITHIPFILYHRRAVSGSLALAVTEKTYPYEAAARAIQEHLDRLGKPACVSLQAHPGYYRVRWALPAEPPCVTIIIPTKDQVDLLRAPPHRGRQPLPRELPRDKAERIRIAGDIEAEKDPQGHVIDACEE
jgi:hypothetical protein